MEQVICGECHCFVPATHWVAHVAYHVENMVAILQAMTHPLGGRMYKMEDARRTAEDLGQRIQMLDI